MSVVASIYDLGARAIQVTGAPIEWQYASKRIRREHLPTSAIDDDSGLPEPTSGTSFQQVRDDNGGGDSFVIIERSLVCN
jgi:hypothetical protein